MHLQATPSTTPSTTPSNNTKPAKYRFFSMPTLGSIVWSYFPLEEAPEEGEEPVRAKPRPALVVGVGEEDGNPIVIVVPGTSKKTEPENIYPSEMVIRKTDDDYAFTGLSHDTKFKFTREIPLPYSEEYFAIPKRKPGSRVAPTSPRLGVLPYSYGQAVRDAAANAQSAKN
ncbi:type II toxin-antitoxin system PemK/MazF family toxin [Leclercia adecarboxylata]|uniref:type II toxin-antitoxin system PemK/MazF family toxin n=1 Tax=Leclercia adecarboxylata TaxID=83655 RepID=UPI001118B8D4|nr:type II toxin-antitoxin system PemK/MazF family toxin [Leclercia adecarboxylata]QCZ30223.1 type II toxin-antitoxin system PemK/MazF family toxin [Leclercia adecarboxylata]QFH68107.1 type II toxin-antitoxin system PemK/MazF family toxin [Leclercia adecarboxylata]